MTDATPPSPEAGPETPRRSPTAILAALAFPATTVAVMQTVVSPILPQLQRAVGVSGSAIVWVLTGNLLASAVATPLIGRLGDLRGRKRFLMVALTACVAGSVLAAATSTYPMLVAGRVLQGLGGAVVPLSLAIVRDTFPAERRAGSIAVIGATISIGSTFGSVMTGLVADHADYHLIFWLSATVAAISTAVVWFVVPDTANRRPGRVDVVGGLLLSGWLALLLGAVSQGGRLGWTSPFVMGGLVGALVLLGAWVPWSLRAHEPLVDLRVMSRRPVLLANCSGMLTGIGMYGSGLLWAPFLQTPGAVGYGFGASVLRASLIMLPGAIGNLAAAPVAGRLINRYGPRPALIAGPLTGGVAFAALVPLTAHVWAFSMCGVMFGFGVGLAFAGMPAVINGNVPQDMTGVANGMNSVLRTVGGAVGTAVLGAVLAAVTTAGGAPSLTAYRVCFGLIAAACLTSSVVASRIVMRREVPGTAVQPAPQPDGCVSTGVAGVTTASAVRLGPDQGAGTASRS